MTKVTFKGQPMQTVGDLPQKGGQAKPFTLAKTDLSEANLEAYQGKKKLLNIFVSLDTSVCALSVEKFSQEAKNHPNTVVLNISMDLPFAHQRFCDSKKICAENLSAFRSSFGKEYGIEITNGPLKGLLARSVIVLDENNKIIYSELVPEITHEPNYKAALEAL